MDKDGYISNGELFLVLKMMVGNNLKDVCILCISAIHFAIASPPPRPQRQFEYN